MELILFLMYFNTSHVNVNHADDSEKAKEEIFQYISC